MPSFKARGVKCVNGSRFVESAVHGVQADDPSHTVSARQHRSAVRRRVLERRRALHVDVDLESKRSKTELYGTRGREDAGAKAETDDGGVIAQKRPRRVACWASGLSALDTTAVISSLLFSHLHPTTGPLWPPLLNNSLQDGQLNGQSTHWPCCFSSNIDSAPGTKTLNGTSSSVSPSLGRRYMESRNILVRNGHRKDAMGATFPRPRRHEPHYAASSERVAPAPSPPRQT